MRAANNQLTLEEKALMLISIRVSLSVICKVLELTSSDVKLIADKNKVCIKGLCLSQQIENEIIDLYENHDVGIKELAKLFSTNYTQIRSILVENGISINRPGRTKGSRVIKPGFVLEDSGKSYNGKGNEIR